MVLLESGYELCCFNHRGKRISVFGNSLPTEEIELTGKPYIISVRQENYDTLRGLIENSGEHGILNSDRKIDTNNHSMLSFQVDGGEYVHLASWGEKSTKNPKLIPQPSIIVEEDNRVRISDVVREQWRRANEKRGYKPRDEISQIFSQIVEDITSGRCLVKVDISKSKAYQLREFCSNIRYHVIEGAKKLGQRTGKVRTTKRGELELDKTATKQFRASYNSQI